jgi:A/G-specific adenine glycosylase
MRRTQTPGALDLAPQKVRGVQAAVLDWYRREHRDLPWRRTRDPYAILVSEVMLQQTQVDRVLPKYAEFLERYPTLAALAAAPRADVIRTWAPLGYNLRAVRLHEIARQAVERCGGALPATRDGLLSLKGIGRYTAAAVACFAYGAAEAVLDTNVRRVLGRIFAAEAPGAQTDDRLAWRLAAAVLPRSGTLGQGPGARGDAPAGVPAGVVAARAQLGPAPHAAGPTAERDTASAAYQAYQWNQALMDLGATICVARAPRCLLCPAQAWCSARAAWLGTQPEPQQPLRLVAERRAAYATNGCPGAAPAAAAPPRARAATTRRTAAAPPERFEGSRRWYRGRVVDVLRALPPGVTVTLAELGPRVKPDFAPDDLAWLSDIARALARDGLIDLQDHQDGTVTLALPA